jgi:hypothetical protein
VTNREANARTRRTFVEPSNRKSNDLPAPTTSFVTRTNVDTDRLSARKTQFVRMVIAPCLHRLDTSPCRLRSFHAKVPSS